jgi:7-cyano-7-deazaguanine synthase
MSRALVILSGGQDSVTCLFWAIREYGRENVSAITFDYGQRHSIELEAAHKVCEIARVEHELITVPKILESTSPLVSNNELERYESPEQMAEVIGNRVELTFVPMRNTFFFTVAANRAVARGCDVLVTGICGEDNANYPDCTEDFRHAFQSMLNLSLGLRAGSIRVEAPLMFCSKSDTVLLARQLPGCWEALAFSHTSYDGKYPPTDMNHSNVLRAKGFADAGFPDPLVIRAWEEGLMELPQTPNYTEFLNGSFPH